MKRNISKKPKRRQNKVIATRDVLEAARILLTLNNSPATIVSPNSVKSNAKDIRLMPPPPSSVRPPRMRPAPIRPRMQPEPIQPSPEPRAGPSGIKKPSTSSRGQNTKKPQRRNVVQEVNGKVPSANYEVNIKVLSKPPTDLKNHSQEQREAQLIIEFIVELEETVSISRILPIMQRMDAYKAQPQGSEIYVVIQEQRKNARLVDPKAIIKRASAKPGKESVNFAVGLAKANHIMIKGIKIEEAVSVPNNKNSSMK